jgi:putative component of membrane protein insertase Oxa1/YidC/SpoIIIJ protein YidD
MKKFLLLLIKIYQALFSPHRGAFRHLYFVPFNCKFSESCSDYAYRAITENGAKQGLKLTFSRLKQCHPL